MQSDLCSIKFFEGNILIGNLQPPDITQGEEDRFHCSLFPEKFLEFSSFTVLRLRVAQPAITS